MNAEKLYYPVFVDVAGKRCLVVGGGRVAERKVRTLLRYGARVEVVSPELSRGLAVQRTAGRIKHVRRRYRKGDARGCVLVFAATDSNDTNTFVAKEVMRRSGLVNVVDTPGLCSFIVPSVVRRGALSIAISTSGKSPALSRAIRKLLEEEFGEELGELVSSLGELREHLKKTYPRGAKKAAVKRRKELNRAAKLGLAGCRTGRGTLAKCR